MHFWNSSLDCNNRKRKRSELWGLRNICAPSAIFYRNYQNGLLGCVNPTVLNRITDVSYLLPESAEQKLGNFEIPENDAYSELRYLSSGDNREILINFLHSVARAFSRGLVPFRGLVRFPSKVGDPNYNDSNTFDAYVAAQMFRKNPEPCKDYHTYIKHTDPSHLAFYENRNALALDAVVANAGDRWLLGIFDCEIEQELGFCEGLMHHVSKMTGDTDWLMDPFTRRYKTKTYYESCKNGIYMHEAFGNTKLMLIYQFTRHRTEYLKKLIATKVLPSFKERARPWKRLIDILRQRTWDVPPCIRCEIHTLFDACDRISREVKGTIQDGLTNPIFGGPGSSVISCKPISPNAQTFDKQMFVFELLTQFHAVFYNFIPPCGSLHQPVGFKYLEELIVHLESTKYELVSAGVDDLASHGNGPATEMFSTFWSVLKDPANGFFAPIRTASGQSFLVPMATIPPIYLHSLVHIMLASYIWRVPPGLNIHPFFLVTDTFESGEIRAGQTLVVDKLVKHIYMDDLSAILDKDEFAKLSSLSSHMDALFYTDDDILQSVADCTRTTYSDRIEDRVHAFFKGLQDAKSRDFYTCWSRGFVCCLRNVYDTLICSAHPKWPMHQDRNKFLPVIMYGFMHGGTACAENNYSGAQLCKNINYSECYSQIMRRTLHEWFSGIDPATAALFVQFATGSPVSCGKGIIKICSLSVDYCQEKYRETQMTGSEWPITACVCDKKVFIPDYWSWHRQNNDHASSGLLEMGRETLLHRLRVALDFGSVGYAFL